MQAQSAGEYAAKAAYLYKLATSTKWPEQSLPKDAPLVIGVVSGDDEFMDTLRKVIAGKTVGAHSITAERTNSNEEMDFCRVVFFRSSVEQKRTEAAIGALASAKILLVGEDDSFLQQGGMVNLDLKNGEVHMEVDRAALDRAKIRLSPELLALAPTPGDTEHGPSAAPAADVRRLKVSTPPEYPEIARRMNITGAVQVELSVRPDGTVKDVKIIGGHPLLAEALAKTVVKWRYEPGPKDSQVVVRFVFSR